MKYKLLLFFLLSLLLLGCSDNKNTNYTQRDILSLTKNEITVKKEEHKILENASSISNSSIPFTLASGFIPHESITEYIDLGDGDQFMYIYNKDKTNISGKLLFDNATDKSINISPVFLQGNRNAMVKLKDASDWSPALQLNIPEDSTVEVEIEIQWDSNGAEELTFFPLNNSSQEERYNGGNLGVFRFSVINNDNTLTREMLDNHYFKLPKNFDAENNTIHPSPSWIGSKSSAINYVSQNNRLFTEDKIKGIQLDSTPYEDTIDIIKMDEYGNVDLILNNIKTKKGIPTKVYFEKQTLKEISINKDKRQFLLILNNRGKNILADIKAVAEGRKPFMTTYQGIIEIYPQIDMDR